MDPVEKDRIIEIQQTRIEHLLNRVLRLEENLRMWVKAEREKGEDRQVMYQEAIEETRILMGNDI